MNVFVTGTGRCGTVSFARACAHMTNFKSGHETHAGSVSAGRLRYPPWHVEVDPHLSWMLGLLIDSYPDAFYVHLQRRREDVTRSWRGRGIKRHCGAAPLIDVICQDAVESALQPRSIFRQQRLKIGI